MALTSAERTAAHRAGYSLPAANRLIQGADIAGGSDEQVIFSSSLPTIGGAALITGVAYWIYVGRIGPNQPLNFVELAVTTAAVGAQVAEAAIAVSTAAPNKAAQSLTCVAAGAITADLTAGTGVFRNATAFAWNTTFGSTTSALGSGTAVHVWCGVRTAMATTQPQVFGLTCDMSQGQILSTAAAGVLAAGTTYTGALIAHAVTWQGPQLRLSTV